MRNWRFMPGEPVQRYAMLGEGLELYSPVGLKLVDDFTGGAVLGRVNASLEILDDSGKWRATDIKALRNASGILIYPGLGRQADVVGLPPRRYRVKLKPDFYRPSYQMLSVTPPPVVTPFYQETREGIEFDVYPYNDALPPTDYSVVPPVEIRPQIRDVKLLPAANYPYPRHVRVLHGKVVDAAHEPVIDVEVKRGITERVLSGERGFFALPLRWTSDGVIVPIDALDHRTALTGQISIWLPDALGFVHTIMIT